MAGVDATQQALAEFVRASGGQPVFTWAQQAAGGRVHALVVCTNEDGGGLVVGVFSGGDGGVVTLLDGDATKLALNLARWMAGDPQ